MAVILLGLGSRGDVQPLSALAAELSRTRGVETRVVALAEYTELIEEPGAQIVPVNVRLSDVMGDGALRHRLAGTALGQLALLRRWAARAAPAFVDAADGCVQSGDVIVTGLLSAGVAHALAEARGCPMATILYTGQLPTLHRESHYCARYFSGWAPYDRWGTRTNWTIATSTGSALTRVSRSHLGLRPAGSRETALALASNPVIVAASPVLVPPAPDWAANVVQTGYLAPEAGDHVPTADLAALLDSRDAVYVGFGSLTSFASERDFALLLHAAALAGRPVITPALAGMTPGWASPNVYAVGSIPHDWLFARVAGVIHHGGAGTTHAGLRAGVPSAAVPFGVDQPYHAMRLHQLGVGPAPLPLRRLTADRLADRIDTMVAGPDTPRYERRAEELGEISRAEDGLGDTAEVIAQLGE